MDSPTIIITNTSRVFRLLFWLLLLSCQVQFGTPLQDAICVNVGYENLRVDPTTGSPVPLFGKLPNGSYASKSEYCNATFNIRSTTATKSAASIGGAKYGSEDKSSAAMSFSKLALGINIADSLLKDCGDLYDATKAEVKVYAVKHNNKYLRGWLHFDINIKEEVVWAFIQVSDERGNAIGEFVTQPQEHTCGKHATSTGSEVYPKMEQFLPCSATGLQEAKPSQALVYTKPGYITPLPSPPPNRAVDKFLGFPKDLTKGLRFKLQWKLNEYFCNRHEKFRLVVHFTTTEDSRGTKDLRTFLFRGHWIFPRWYGAADIARHGETLTCPLQLVTRTVEDENKLGPFWIKRIEESVPANDILTPANAEKEGPSFPPTLLKSCRTYLTRLTEYVDDVKKQPSYGGRCEKIDEKKFKPGVYKAKGQKHSKSSVDVPHQCLENENIHADYPSNMENYQEYMNKKKAQRKVLCGAKAAKCPTKEELQELVRDVLESRKYPARNATGRYIWKSRAFHGMVFTVAALFLIPVSNFMARFFKETFLAEAIVGMRIWYFIHLASTVMTINLFMGGYMANLKVARVWGRSHSKAGEVHRLMGWTWVGLFVFVTILGPLRPIKACPRLVVMILHTLLGYLHYYIGLFTILTSTIIPGSPSATVCYKKIKGFDPFVEPKFSDMYKHQAATTVTWWLFLDIFFHALMNYMQWCADRSWQVTRLHYFPLLPVARVDDRRSFKCFRYRTLVLCIYILILSVLVIVTCQRYYESDWKGCDCGPLTCTHANLSPDSVYKSVRCGRMETIRDKRVEYLKANPKDEDDDEDDDN